MPNQNQNQIDLTNSLADDLLIRSAQEGRYRRLAYQYLIAQQRFTHAEIAEACRLMRDGGTRAPRRAVISFCSDLARALERQRSRTAQTTIDSYLAGAIRPGQITHINSDSEHTALGPASTRLLDQVENSHVASPANQTVAQANTQIQDQQLITSAVRGRVTRVAYNILLRGGSPHEAVVAMRQVARAPENWTERYTANLRAVMLRQNLIRNDGVLPTSAPTELATDNETFQDFTNRMDCDVARSRLRSRFIRVEERIRDDGTQIWRLIFRRRGTTLEEYRRAREEFRPTGSIATPQITIQQTSIEPPFHLNRVRAAHQIRPTPVNGPSDEPIEQIQSECVNTTDFDSATTFGVEIEFLIPGSMSHSQLAHKMTMAGITTQCESYGHDEDHRDRHQHLTRTWWKITTDSSVRSHMYNYNGGNELVSPILKGLDGLKQLEKVCKVLNENQIIVNKSCGLHVHHGCREIHGQQAEAVARNAVVIYDKYQSKFNKMMPKSRRNCRHARPYPNAEIRKLREQLECSTDRFRVVNLQAYWRHGTVEFRQHSGTVELAKIINWIKITQKVMIRAKELVSNDIWTYQFRRFENELGFGTGLTSYVEARYQKFSPEAVAEAA